MYNETLPFVDDVQLALQIVSTSMIIFFSILLVLQIFAFHESRAKTDPKSMEGKAIHDLRLYIFMNSLSNLLIGIIGLIVAVQKLNELECTVLMKLTIVPYCIGTQVLYLFFALKAKLVSQFERGKLYRSLMLFANVTAKFGVPLALLPLALWMYGPTMLSDGTCTQKTIFPWFGMMFGIGNIFFGGILTYLFVYPLWENAQRVKKGSRAMSDRMLGVAKRNIYLAVSALIFTTLNCIFQTIANVFAQDYNESFLVVAYFLVFIDCSINGIVMILMTHIWLPSSFQKKVIAWYQGGGSSHDTQKIEGSLDDLRMKSTKMTNIRISAQIANDCIH